MIVCISRVIIDFLRGNKQFIYLVRKPNVAYFVRVSDGCVYVFNCSINGLQIGIQLRAFWYLLRPLKEFWYVFVCVQSVMVNLIISTSILLNEP